MSEERKSRYELFLEEEARKAQPTKRCSRCKVVKALSEYYRDRRAARGVMSACKECEREPRKYRDKADRFWKRFHARTQRVGQCIEWKGTMIKEVPSCWWNGKKSASVRRIVYQLSIGELPDDMYVTPICKNVRCVRQSHLKRITRDEFLVNLYNSHFIGQGSHPGNGGGFKGNPFPHGEAHPSAKLTADTIREIRRRRDGGESLRSIASAFGISHPNVIAIVRYETWAHVQ